MLFKPKTFVYFSQKVALRLSFEYFISRKTLKSVVQGKKVSKPIVRISVISIALAMIVNLITVAVVTGFQQEVRQKVSGFGAHILIMNGNQANIYDSDPIRIDQPMVEKLRNDKRIASISPVGYKPVLFQSKLNKITYELPSGKDTTEIEHQVHGAIIKGVNDEYNTDFYQEHLIDGKIPDFSKSENDHKIVVSKKIAETLNYTVGDTVSAFFVKNQPVKELFEIAGIYDTGLEEFDKKTVLGELSTVQKLKDWGIQASIEVADTMFNDQLIIKGIVHGGNGNIRYDWGDGFDTYSGFTLCPIKDTVIRLVATDYITRVRADVSESTIPDTAYLAIHIEGTAYSACDVKLNEFGEIKRKYLDNTGNSYSVQAGMKTINFTSIPGNGSEENYIGGFEININNWDELDAVVTSIKKKVDFIPTIHNEFLHTSDIRENQRDIFVWLDFLDINVLIIIVLMVIIGIINMGSAFLVLILIRSNFIGMLKAMGATNWSIRKIFLIQASYLIGRGLIIGNIIGVGICLIQSQYGVFTLNPEVYYLSKVPIQLDVIHLILLNAGTLVICLTALILPSTLVARISPIKTIKFN